MNKLMEKLARGEKALGFHIQSRDIQMTEVIASLGFDYLWIDMEHSALQSTEVEDHLLAARCIGTPCLVRIPWNDPVLVKPILEMGPAGVIFPMIRSYEEAKKAVANCLYPPKGVRSFGPRYASRYGQIPVDEYLKQTEEDTMRIIQIEHVDAVSDLDRIVTVEGISAFIIGPMDLSASMGKLGKTHDPEFCSTIDTIVQKIHAAGKLVGLSYGLCGRDEIEWWHRRGMDFMSLANEMDLVISKGRELLGNMKDIMLS
jgi:2-dehydro-3-deoxyglucarate aldolase/4-hydroxy-2-oxoheptanedioate aldolase